MIDQRFGSAIDRIGGNSLSWPLRTKYVDTRSVKFDFILVVCSSNIIGVIILICSSLADSGPVTDKMELLFIASRLSIVDRLRS